MGDIIFRHRASELIVKEMKGEISDAERAELKAMNLEEVDWAGELGLIEGLKERLDRKVEVPDRLQRSGMRRWWWAAAAVVFVVCGLWFVVEVPRRSAPRNDKGIVENDVKAPDSSKATITLADGKVIVPVVKNGKVEIVKETEYNILNNPRGSQVVNLTLSDGTIVWLNNESSLKYPTSFDNTERVVEITGEAFFECKTPGFKVIANGVTITDLGTEFNVNSYEGTITTLVKGIVEIQGSSQARNDKGAVRLKPGDQALNDKITGQVDVQQVIAWKNGLFEFDNTDLAVIMKQISRWYDVEVVYEGKPAVGKLGGGISRNLPLSKVMELLRSNGVNIKLEGRKIIIR